MKESKKIGLYLFLYTRGELSPAEHVELREWRNQDPENEKLFFQMTDPDSLRNEMQDYYKQRDADFEKLKTRLPFLSESNLTGSVDDHLYDYNEADQSEEKNQTEDSYASSVLSPVEYWGSMIADDFDDKDKLKTGEPLENKVLESDSDTTPRKRTRKQLIQTLLAVAACLSVVMFQINQKSPKSGLERFQASIFSSDAVSRAYEDLSRGFAAGRAGIKIHDNANGEPVYVMPNEISADYSKFYLLKTPADGEFILQLPDSTLIWLNGSSTIKYPANFNQHDIAIEFSGEVYIERSGNAFYKYTIKPATASDQKPAINGQPPTIALPPFSKLDINNYPDNEGLLVTLISGETSKNVGTAEKGFHLLTGKQVVIINDSVSHPLDFTASEVTSWRNGTFYYRQTSIQNIMPAIAKWYEMDVQYPFGIPDKKFNLRMDRSASVTDILDNLKLQGLNVTHLGKNITIWK